MSKTKKTILVGIDYSKSGDNALDYAVMMARKGNAKILLFHMYETPVIHTYSGAYFISYTEMQGYNKEKLEKYKEKFMLKHWNLEIETFATYKTFKNGVTDLIKSHKVHYVVLGLESKSRFSKFIYGTTGLDVAGKISCPVIIVPEKYKEHKLNKAVLALDNRKSVETKVMQKVDAFNKQFKIKKDIIHVKTENEFLFVSGKKAAALNKKWKVNIVEASNFEQGIINYSKQNKIDLISLISHSHSLIYDLFNESNTKMIAFKSRIPIMSIHE
jgi:nucleotide-binding universal stress UspA family protein